MRVEFSDDSFLVEGDDLTLPGNKELHEAERKYEEFKFVSHTPWLDNYE